MDVFQDYILVTYNPFDVHIFHVTISGELSPANSPVLQVTCVKICNLNSEDVIKFYM
jgi:RAB6A-GEF complex partner protein 1